MAFRHLPVLDGAWSHQHNGTRLDAVRQGAQVLRGRLAEGSRVVSVRTFDQATLLYPTKYAFGGAALSPVPYVMMTHRALLVQFLEEGELRHLLFNPTDVVASRRTPFFRKTIEQLGDFLAFSVLTKTFDSLESQLAQVGVGPSDIDYVAFDHFHTQDLRTLIGTSDGTHLARFPRAKLIAPKREWDDWDNLHPLQRAWFVPDGKQGVPSSKIVFTDGDLALGEGVYLLRTPGHTAGNQTLFVNTESGIWGCSENGTCADNWSPHESAISGLKSHARTLEHEVVLNANTPEWAADQYTSMVLERTLVDRVKRAPVFAQMFSSSEVTESVFAPGIKPTFSLREIKSGTVVGPSKPSMGAPVVSR